MAQETKNETPWQAAEFKEEIAELRKGVSIKTGFPKPKKRYRLEFESENYNVEEMYSWLIGHAHYDFDMPVIKKVLDTYAASSASSVFGDMQARLGNQQSLVSNYLGMIGKLLKDLFSLVRELRQIEERLGYYTDSYKKDSSASHVAEATLKDIWVNMVEGGGQNPSSVIGLSSSRVGFVVLPDLFFQFKPVTEDKIKEEVAKLEFNEAVKGVLERKLMQFTQWKKSTYAELTNKRSFQIRYLRQHYEVIQMYMNWIKPYLKNIRRLQFNEKIMDGGMLIHSFESAVSEIEVMTIKPQAKAFKPDLSDLKDDDVLSIVNFHFVFQTKPQLNYHAKESWQQKGPIHIGRVETSIRVYGWTKKQLNLYLAHREQESWDILSSFDMSVKEAMEYLGDDLKRFLKESYANASIPLPPFLVDKKVDATPKKEEVKDTGMYDLVAGPFLGMWELIKPMTGDALNISTWFKDTSEEDKKAKRIAACEAATKPAIAAAWNCFKNYKKAHRMISW